MTKFCRTCGVEKEIDEYYVHQKMADGHLNICKDCTKKRVGNHRSENIEKIREYDRNRPNKDIRNQDFKNKRTMLKELNPEKFKELERKRLYQYRKKYPEKDAARQMVRNAIVTGKLDPLPCERCGSLYRIEAHHHDYSKPLDVIWLCDFCHKEEHKRLRKIERENKLSGKTNLIGGRYATDSD